MITVGIYNENLHEQISEEVAKIYPKGIHGQIASFLESDEIQIRTYTLETVEKLTPQELSELDVLIWWGHMAHDKVPDSIAYNVRDAVLTGMGAIFLHSAHKSKPFDYLMGTGCDLTWREDGDMERVWNTAPAHPIMKGIGRFFIIPGEETYGEPFTIPEPDQVIMMGWYSGGEVFRSGCTFHRQNGKIFYFQPGHETFPIYYMEEVQTIIRNAVRWAKPDYRISEVGCVHVSKP